MDDFEKLPLHNIVWVQKWIDLNTYKTPIQDAIRIKSVTIQLNEIASIAYAHDYTKPYGETKKYFASYAIYRDVSMSQRKYIGLKMSLEECLKNKYLIKIEKNEN